MFKQVHLHTSPTRRLLLSGIAVALVAPHSRALAQSSTALNAVELGLVANIDADQSAAFQGMIDAAAQSGLPLFVPGGTYKISGITLPSNITLTGLSGATVLRPARPEPVFAAREKSNVHLRNIAIDGAQLEIDVQDLVSLSQCTNIALDNLDLRTGSKNAIVLEQCQGRVENCRISGFRLTGIHLQNSAGMILKGNRVGDCGNGGIRVWRWENGRDGSIVVENQISGIGSDSGNGQNGNGINIFRADEVIVANNSITDCAFSAIRANSTNNTIISGNVCSQSQEVAIFSEFAFTGSIIADNIVDQAAQGISITNFNEGGRLATCSGNIVRNIWPFSPTNPDTSPVGIFAEADTAISGNVVESVPGTGILAGWGPYLRNVLISNNVVRDTNIGIGASVADGAGLARISNNLISDTKLVAISAMRWKEMAGSDLAQSPDQFSTLSVQGNSIG